jgi:hypothetical protein
MQDGAGSRSLRGLALLATALCLTGCSTLYSETRNKQGEDLKAAYAKVDLTAPVAASRKNLNALLDEQLKLEDELWHHYGTTQAHLAATDWTIGDFRNAIKTRSAEIAGDGVDYSALVGKKDEAERLAMAGPGEYRASRQKHQELQAAQVAARAAVAAAKQAVEVASADYEKLLKELSKEPENAKKVDAAKKKLDDAVGNLTKLQTGVGQEFLSSARLEGLNEFLATYESIRAGKGAPEGSNKLAIALALFPDIQDQVEKVRLDGEKPRLLPFVMAKQVEQAKLAAAKRNVARLDTTIRLQNQHADTLFDQLNTLDTAKQGLAGLSDNMALRDLLRPLKPGQEPSKAALDDRIKAWRTLALYLRAQDNLRAQQNKIQHQIIALGYEEPLTHAESGLQQWKALLDPSVELLGLYGAAGLKAKDIQDFLNTLALLWIAAKVN